MLCWGVQAYFMKLANARMSAESDKPLMSYASESAASAAYWLASAGSEIMLPKTDLAGRLPAGARIQKIKEGAYRGVQLDSGRDDKPALITATAYENIVQFVPYFHG